MSDAAVARSSEAATPPMFECARIITRAAAALSGAKSRLCVSFSNEQHSRMRSNASMASQEVGSIPAAETCGAVVAVPPFQVAQAREGQDRT